MKIKEDNIVNNISDIEAIYGKIDPKNLEFYEQLAQKDTRIAELEQQLRQATSQNVAPRVHKKGKETRLVKRKVEKSKTKGSKSNGSDKFTKKRKNKSLSRSPSTSESSSDSDSKKMNKHKRSK
jgi:hypothetical protein